MDNNENKKPGKPLKNVVVLSGIAIQMGVTIYLFVLLGKWLDTKFSTDQLFLIVMTLLGVAISLYAVIKQVNRIKY